MVVMPLEASSSVLDSASDGEKCSGVVTWRWRKENQKKNRDEGVISCSLRKWVSKGIWWFHPWVWRLWSSENGCLMTLSHFFNEEFKKTPPSLVVGVVVSFYTGIKSHCNSFCHSFSGVMWMLPCSRVLHARSSSLETSRGTPKMSDLSCPPHVIASLTSSFFKIPLPMQNRIE